MTCSAWQSWPHDEEVFESLEAVPDPLCCLGRNGLAVVSQPEELGGQSRPGAVRGAFPYGIQWLVGGQTGAVKRRKAKEVTGSSMSDKSPKKSIVE